MTELRAKVRNGRLVLDEPTDLPEGTIVHLVLDDEGDDLDPSEREALNKAILKAWEQVLAGRSRPAEDVLSDLKKRR